MSMEDTEGKFMRKGEYWIRAMSRTKRRRRENGMTAVGVLLCAYLIGIIVGVDFGAAAFYLPGTQPVDWIGGEQVNLMVQNLMLIVILL